MLETAPEGVIAGGWSFVIAAYGITGAVLLAYVWSLVKRRTATDTEEEVPS